jgi:hypothetical protein
MVKSELKIYKFASSEDSARSFSQLKLDKTTQTTPARIIIIFNKKPSNGTESDSKNAKKVHRAPTKVIVSDVMPSVKRQNPKDINHVFFIKRLFFCKKAPF